MERTIEMKSESIEQSTIYLKKDYYGNKGYGKRAYWFVDEHGNYKRHNGADFVFVAHFEEWSKEPEQINLNITKV